MKMLVPLLLTALAATAPLVADGQPAQRRSDAQDAWDARRQGRLLPLREIEAKVVPLMRGAQYLGFEFESESGIYTLKFLRNGSVIWVAVDGHSGQIVGRAGD
ncbi:hypothetical protein QH494_10790 [Sphingomonas sp. AR_OL41]|uniref:hypothetical protein n=1 Tax=Sphingomonas sp. AR_OL41 TaxID=3042729 RepID=UPI0024802074|nr:hypothetical protein [Sphingomonas sp. AR_OL41]MDH7972670.1 hypothetical protein [Sphingomonas sp. AR_OL41]